MKGKHFPELKLYRKGKVRNVYDFEDKLLLVATDRISAFDFILNQRIPFKGEVLNKISEFWFKYFSEYDNHYISTDVLDFPIEARHHDLIDRSMLVRKSDPIDIECVVRGYIIGSGWKEYQQTGSVCGIKLKEGLQLAEKLDEPIFTPAFKNREGHDENISFEKMIDLIGKEKSEYLKEASLDIYKKASSFLYERGVILADTKLEFGEIDGKICIIDEMLTPDSSRFWVKDDYCVGMSPKSYDKQICRDYLEKNWDKKPPIPDLPQEIIEKISKAYLEIRNIFL